MLSPEILDLKEGITAEFDPLKLELEDSEFVDVLDAKITSSVTYYEGKKLYTRQDTNLDYYLGEQLKHNSGFDGAAWHPQYVENVIYEGVRRIKPIATSRLPDLTVKSGQNPKVAELMTDVLNTDIRKRENRKVLGLAHVHEQLFFYAVIKARWNPEMGDDGDYEFLNIYPKNIVWDHTCKTNNADDMSFVAENAELSIKEIIMMFPQSKEALLGVMGYDTNDKRTEKNLATKIKLWEVWFHWYKEGKDDYGNSKWEKVHGVVWKYETLVLGKMRNPYYDYEGKVNLFDPKMKERNGVPEEELFAAFMGKSKLQQQTIYYNYFKNPRKPYFFVVYESLGQDPIDATNRIEQVLRFQDHINDEGRQIIEMNERSAGKALFSSDALDKDVVKKLDWRNTRQALTVNGDDINKTFAVAQMPAAPQQLYQSKQENRSIAFEMLGVNATTRGVKEGDQTLGEARMFREQDFGMIDDLVEDTINDAAEWQSQWAMQFIRVFYTAQHFKEIVGKDGESLYTAVTQDLVDDGMIVEVSASAVDKLLRKRLAMEIFKLGAGDLLSFYEDLDMDQPKERARRAFLQQSAPQVYYQQYLAPEGQGVAGPVQIPPPPGAPPAPGVPAPMQPPPVQPPPVAAPVA